MLQNEAIYFRNFRKYYVSLKKSKLRMYRNVVRFFDGTQITSDGEKQGLIYNC